MGDALSKDGKVCLSMAFLDGKVCFYIPKTDGKVYYFGLKMDRKVCFAIWLYVLNRWLI